MVQKHNAIALILEPYDDTMDVVQKFWTLPKDSTHIMLFARHTRHNAFIDWKFSQCGYKTRFILPEPGQNEEWNLERIQQWISQKRWFPQDSRLLITRTSDIKNTYTNNMVVEMYRDPIYNRDVHTIIVQK